MNAASNSPVRHCLQDPVPILHAYHVKVVNMTSVISLRGQNHFLNLGQMLVVNPGVGSSCLVASSQVLQFHAKGGALNSIHPRVPTNQGMVVFLCLPMVPQHLDFNPQFLVVGDHRSCFPEGAQVLAGIKTEATGCSNRPGLPASEFCAMRLAGVLNHRQPPASRNLKDRIHVSRLAEQMDRDNRLGPRSDGAFQ